MQDVSECVDLLRIFALRSVAMQRLIIVNPFSCILAFKVERNNLKSEQYKYKQVGNAYCIKSFGENTIRNWFFHTYSDYLASMELWFLSRVIQHFWTATNKTCVKNLRIIFMIAKNRKIFKKTNRTKKDLEKNKIHYLAVIEIRIHNLQKSVTLYLPPPRCVCETLEKLSAGFTGWFGLLETCITRFGSCFFFVWPQENVCQFVVKTQWKS